MKKNLSRLIAIAVAAVFSCSAPRKTTTPQANANPWPVVTQQMKPWTRWWWMGSAVDEANLDRLLTTYSEAGLGGVEVTPIYGAKGFENRYINFLSPRWLQVLNHTVQKANALGMGVDLNTGTGWPFGGPHIRQEDAASRLIIQTYRLTAGQSLAEKLVVSDEKQRQAGAYLQALTAYNDKGQTLSLIDKVSPDGQLQWVAPAGNWQLYAAFCGKTLQKVKRAAPGGEGLVVDHLAKAPLQRYLAKFDEAFRPHMPGIRAFFNDSYEVYDASWSPQLFETFLQKRGYDLRLHLKQLAGDDTTALAARIKSDYRETMGDMLLENFTRTWTGWAHSHGKVTKNQAHGSPGNLLDLYGAVDIPECETHFGPTEFDIPGLRRDTNDVVDPEHNAIIFKFASSAAHVYGKPLTSAETLVWLTDHFKTSPSQAKPEVERLFLSGINHTFYHGTTYSPAEVPFPGWQFYASVNFTPTNSLWPHLSGLNNYIARCQSLLQAGSPDNDLLIYWPVYDNWHKAKGLEMQFSFHNTRSWLTPTPFYALATQLQQAGYAQDFVSDHMLAQMNSNNGGLQLSPAGNRYQALVVPAAEMMPVATLQRMLALARQGATVVFEQLPKDVPGYHELASRRSDLQQLLSGLAFSNAGNGVQKVSLGQGQLFLATNVQQALAMAGIRREPLAQTGLQFIRRSVNGGTIYYLVNHTAKAIDARVPLATAAGEVVMMDPQSGAWGKADATTTGGSTLVRIQLQPGEAIFLQANTAANASVPGWKYIDNTGTAMEMKGNWQLEFTAGGPQLPRAQQLQNLVSWTALPDTNAVAFSGTGVYTTTFNLPAKKAGEYLLDLGDVRETARVWINGQDAGIFWSLPFRGRVGQYLKPGANTIKIEVNNLMANRIRDMDLKGITWRNYHEINFVNIHYKPFDASPWKPMPSGLLGPVRLVPVN